MSDASAPPGRNWTIFLVVCASLILTLIWRVVVPAHEYPMRTEQVLDMGLQAIAVMALVGLRIQLNRDGVERGAALFWIALFAGIGLFAIRFHSNASWWTGHLSYVRGQ